MYRRLHYFIVYTARGAEFFWGGSENVLDYIVYDKGDSRNFGHGSGGGRVQFFLLVAP